MKKVLGSFILVSLIIVSSVYANGNIEWSAKYNEYPKYINGLYWQDDSQSRCNKKDGFYPPSLAELNKIGGGSYKFDYYSKDAWYRSSTKSKYGKYLLYRISTSETTSGGSSLLKCVRKQNNLDKLNIIEMAKGYTEKDLKGEKLILSKKPIFREVEGMTKGEFETTTMFKERAETNKLKIELENKHALAQWEQKVAQERQVHGRKLQQLKENSTQLLLNNILKSLYLKYGVPKIISVKYNADKEIFEIILESKEGDYNEKVQLPVKLKYAKKFKDILMDKNFKPTIEFQLINDKLVFSGIKEIKDPEILVEENEYKKAYAKNSVHELQQFIAKYPNSTFKSSAESRISTLNEEKRLKEEKERLYREQRAKEDRIREEQRAKEKQRKQDSYYAKKHIGDKVCKDGITAIILSITITGYVENVNGNNIQIRISDTEGTTPHMNGVTLYRNTLIWDDYSDWYKCNY